MGSSAFGLGIGQQLFAIKLHLRVAGLSNYTIVRVRDRQKIAKAISFALRPNGLVKGRLRLLAACLPLLPIAHVDPAIQSINQDPSDTKPRLRCGYSEQRAHHPSQCKAVPVRADNRFAPGALRL